MAEARRPGRQVFLSHASDDAADGLALVAALEAAGVACWIAPRDVREGEPFVDEIMAGIRECPVFTLLHTPGSDASAHVMRELTQAASLRRRLLSVRLGRFPASEGMRYYLDPVQAVVCDSLDDDRTLATVISRVRRLLEDGEPTPDPSRPIPAGWRRSDRRRFIGWAAVALAAVAVVAAWLAFGPTPTPTRDDAPLAPGSFPDPTTAFPRLPPPDDVSRYVPPVPAADVTIEYSNETGSPLTLLLFDCDHYYGGRSYWNEFPLPADAAARHFNSFFPGKGWFLAGVVDQDRGFHYLGEIRLFEHAWSRLTIARDGEAFRWHVDHQR